MFHRNVVGKIDFPQLSKIDVFKKDDIGNFTIFQISDYNLVSIIRQLYDLFVSYNSLNNVYYSSIHNGFSKGLSIDQQHHRRLSPHF